MVLSADVKRVDGQFRVFAKGGREDTGRDALDWISWCVDHGAGEICLNSIDTDGVRSGFDLEMLDAVAARRCGCNAGAFLPGAGRSRNAKLDFRKNNPQTLAFVHRIR